MSKKVILIFLLVNVNILATIIYVHIGPTIPSYLYVALEQARLFNTQREVCLLANREALNRSTYDWSVKKITTVPLEELNRTMFHRNFLARTPHNRTYMNGFWAKAIERFFFLQEYITERDLRGVVHLESDNMLYVNIDEIDPVLTRYKGIGAVLDADQRCIPSFVYIANKEAITSMITYISDHARQPLFDMQFIAAYRTASSSEKIDNLPLVMPEYLERYELVNALKHKPRNPKQYVNNCIEFNSIFDGAAIGQYLGGIDPMHGQLKIGFINETCLFNPSRFQYEWRKDASGRRVPFALFSGNSYRINNLHIHSKQLDKFRS